MTTESYKHMERKNYMQEVDAWLDGISITEENQRKEIKAKILESFKNGKSMRYSKNRTGAYAHSQTNTQGTAYRGNSADDRTTAQTNVV